MIYLRRGLLTLKPKLIAKKCIGESYPINLGVRHMMRIKIPGGSPKFGGKRYLSQQIYLCLEPLHKNVNLFPQIGR